MKTAIFFLFCLFSVLCLVAQDDKFLMIPEPGMEHKYEFIETKYIHNEAFEKKNELVKKKMVRIVCSAEENNRILLVKLIRNTVEKPNDELTKYKDYFYPELRDGFYGYGNAGIYEEILCRLDFKYGFNDNRSIISLENCDELLLKTREILNEKGYSQSKIKEHTTVMNKSVIPEFSRKVQSLFRVDQDLTGDFLPKQPDYDSKLAIKDSILTVSNKRWDVQPGIYLAEWSYHQKEKYLLDYRTIHIDTLRRYNRRMGEAFRFKAEENSIQLAYRGVFNEDRFIISGTIESPGATTVTLSVLTKTYGKTMHSETVFLDDDNSFRFDIEMKHPGMVYIQFGENSVNQLQQVHSFYAEPGGNIHFKAKGGTFPWKMEITGSNPEPSKLMYDLRVTNNILKQNNFQESIWDFRVKPSYRVLLKSYKNFDEIVGGYKANMDEESFKIVTNELRATLYSNFFSYLSLNYNIRLRNINLSYYPVLDEIDFDELEQIVDSCDFQQIYYPYGIFSRRLAEHYYNYHSRKMQKVHEVKKLDYRAGTKEVDFYYSNDISQKVELARTLLTGHALYNILIDVFLSETGKEQRHMVQDKEYTLKKIDEYLDLMIRRANDEQFLTQIKEIRERNLQWQSEDFIPKAKFFDQSGNEKYFKDFLGEKPTVFYISSQWATERYYWDKLAKENPELNVVMVTSGNDFEAWADYMKRAEPIAEQILLINTEGKLSDIFLKTYRHYVAYDKSGKLIGIKDSADEILELARESLKVKESQLNKSQLQTIIIVLLAILAALIIGLLIWKWRVRQRFRKEEQNRKLKELELTAIRSQMNPHFLFNSLNSVQNLVQQNKGREAHLYLSDFAGLIRKVLNNSEKEEVSLAEELEMIKQYLSLEKLRFDFEFSLNIDSEIDVHNTMVPSMLLQPFVENAIVHGLQNKTGSRQLKIEISKEPDARLTVPDRLAHITGSSIRITIEDNGIGRKEAKVLSKQKNGKGTKLMNDRLKLLEEKQGEKYDLAVVDLEQGTRVEIIVPEEN